MKASIQVELECGLRFQVEHEVRTLADLRKLLQKGDAKIAACVKPMPELADEKLAKARIAVESAKPAANAA
jgi:hypothetical protein